MAGEALEIVSTSGKKVGSRSLPEGALVQSSSKGLLHEVVRWQRAKKRAGTHTVKTRHEVRGGGTKPWRQKGTGRARAGSIRSPLWVGGGVAHGPKQRSYEFSLNKSGRRLALRQALGARFEEGKLLAVDTLDLSEISTKKAVAVLAGLGIEKSSKALVVCETGDDVAKKSFRNIPGAKVISADGLNVYDILNSQYVVIVDSVFPAVLERLGVKSEA